MQPSTFSTFSGYGPCLRGSRGQRPSVAASDLGVKLLEVLWVPTYMGLCWRAPCTFTPRLTKLLICVEPEASSLVCLLVCLHFLLSRS